MNTIFKIAILEYLNSKYCFKSQITCNDILLHTSYIDGIDYTVKNRQISGFYQF